MHPRFTLKILVTIGILAIATAKVVVTPPCLVYPIGSPGWPLPGPLRQSPTSSVSGATAIVLIHGWQRTKDCNDFATAESGEVYFSGLVPVIDSRFGRDNRVMVFTYPTFNPFQIAGGQLAALLDDAAQNHGVSSVIFVGHSMGGLVARAAAQELTTIYRRPALVRGILTLATPHNGIPRADQQVVNAIFFGLDQGAQSLFDGLQQQQSEPPIFAYAGYLTPNARNPLAPCPGTSGSGVIPKVYALNCAFLAGKFAAPSDGLVQISSALPSFATTVHPLFTNYDHTEMKAGDGGAGLPSDPLFAQIVSDLRGLIPPPAPEFVVSIGCACNPISLAVVGTDLIMLVGVGGTSNVVARLFQFSMATGATSEPLGPFSPGLGALPAQLRSDGNYIYWSSGGFSVYPYTIKRLPVNGGAAETVVTGVTAGPGGHY